MKILVGLLFLGAIYNLFFGGTFYKMILKESKDVWKGIKINQNPEEIEKVFCEDKRTQILTLNIIMFVMAGIELIVSIVSFFTTLSLIKYDPKHIVLAYFILCVIINSYHSISSSSKAKINKEANIDMGDYFEQQLIKEKKFSLVKLGKRIIKFSFWSYAIYLVFIL